MLSQPIAARRRPARKSVVGAALRGAERRVDFLDVESSELKEMVAVLRAQLTRVLENRTVSATSSVPLYLRTQQKRVAECLAMLERISQVAVHHLGQRQRLEGEVIDAKIELGVMRAAVAAAKANEKRARYLAMHDSTTTLPNERSLQVQLDQAIMNCESPWASLAVLYIDLDGFKAVNDTYGHGVGNDLLRVIAARLHRTVRAEDIVGRVGGDEFVCILTGSPKRDQVGRIACHLFDKIGAALTFGGLTFSVRSSIGIAIYPQDGATAATLLKSADRAMYQSKRAQSGPVFFGEGTDAGPPTLIRRSASDTLQ